MGSTASRRHADRRAPAGCAPTSTACRFTACWPPTPAGWSSSSPTTSLTAVLDYGGTPRLLATFPFPHVLELDVTLADRTLTVETTVTPTDRGVGAAVLRLPPVSADARRAARGVAAADAERCATCPVDNWGIPTGAHGRLARGHRAAGRPASSTTASTRCPRARCSRSSGGDRRIEVTFDEGYPGGADLRARRRRRDRHRADGRADRRAAPRRTTASRLRQAGERPVLDQARVLDARAGCRRCARRWRGCQTTSAVLFGTTATSRRCMARNALQLVGQLGEPRLQRLDLVGQLDDALDAGEVDALVLRQPLHLAQQVDVVLRVASAAAGTALRADQAEPVVGAQRLRVHAGQLGGHRDQERPGLVIGALGSHHAPAHPARGSNPLARSAFA